MDYQSLPTPETIASLTESVRRDPGAGAFVELGNCYLMLGRPKDAVDIGAIGLRASGTNLAGRLMVATGLAQLHRWKEAQAELLKLVKADRNNANGFRLLGEVLMRRNDFDRALPVLQHAQALEPQDPKVLAMLQRAHAGQPLDPPPPIPEPQAREAEPAMEPAMEPAEQDSDYDDELPTRVAGFGGPGGTMPPPIPPGPAPPAPPAPALGRVDLQQREMPSTPAPRDSVVASVATDTRNSQQSFSPVEHHSKPDREDPLAPLGSPTVRPRMIPVQKSKDAAHASLRESAAVGEQYLNQLLLGGLLDVPNVRVSDAKYDIAPGKRWGRSTVRMFIYLFVVLLAAGAGGGTWYWYANKQMAAVVARHIETAKGLTDSCDREDLAKATVEARSALNRDRSNVQTMALLAEVTGLSTLLYGEFSPGEVERAVDSVARSVSGPGAQGYRELVIARSAQVLSALPSLEVDADARLAETVVELRDWLERSPDDQLARWLLGRALLAAGERGDAGATFEKAYGGGEGPLCAAIDLGNFRLDEGDFEGAMKLFESVLSTSQNHPLAFVGRSLARSERHIESEEAMADISIGLAQAKGEKLLAWKSIALAGAHHSLEDYEGFEEALAAADKVVDPRFLARVGLARVRQGKIADAARIRSEIRWFAADPEPHPLVTMLDVELLLARGLPQEALDAIGERSGLQAASVRGRAKLDLGDAPAALKEFEAALEASPEDRVLKAWTAAALMMSTKGDERRKADESLKKLGLQAKLKTVRYVHGVALVATGKRAGARVRIEQSVDGVSDELPSPLAYRSYLMLARLDVLNEDGRESAIANLEKSLGENAGYLPTRDLLGQLLVDTDAPKAMEHLADVFGAGVESIGAQLALARALVKTGGSKENAVKLIGLAQERGASEESLQIAIAEVDPGLFETLAVPAPEPEE